MPKEATPRAARVLECVAVGRLVGDPVMRANTGNGLVLVQPTDFTAEDFK